MTEIRPEHIEWAVVDRLMKMLKVPGHDNFHVTETFAYFSSVLCWVLQHVRISGREQETPGDCRAASLATALEQESIHAEPWCIQLGLPVAASIRIPAAEGFADHNVMQFMKNLRDAVAHGDARNVKPFHSRGSGADRRLLGFTFQCAELKNRKPVWSGSITLLQSDMRHIATTLAKLYCDAVSGKSEDFMGDARRHVKEAAA